MDYQTVEVLNPRGDDAFGHQAFKQDRVTAGANRTPTPKTRRATGESVYRDRKPGHSRPAGGTSMSKITSATSTPRPIPKQNKGGNINGKSLQPPSSYSYSFDDNVVDPFMPSTPPTFIASMEPTFFKSDITANKNKSKEDPGPSKRVDEAPVTKPPNSTARRPRPRSSTISTPSTTSYPTTSSPRAPDSPKSPVPTSSKSGISQMREARMRDTSISSILKPSHDDMILPAVARRIKEEGLFNHDVIAYSDDYNAPLYRLPTTSGGVGNPFASYDREKAASSSNLSTSKGPSSDNDQHDGSKNEKPTINSRYEEDPIKKTHKKQSSSASPVQRETSPTPLERRQTPSSSPVPEAIPQAPTPLSYEPREDKNSDTVLTTVQEPSIPAGSRPDRPRRARRNTEGRQRMDLQEQEQYARQQSPTPDRKGQVSENDIQALDVRGTMQGNDRSNRQQRRRSKTMDQSERYNASNDFYSDIQTVEAQFVVPKKPTAHQQHESNDYRRRQNQYPNNEVGDRYEQQYDQQYSNNNYQSRQYRNEEPSAQRSPKKQHDRPQQAQDSYYGRQESQQQYQQQYHQESKYVHEPQYTQEPQYAQEQQYARQHRQKQQLYSQPEDQQHQNDAQGARSRYNKSYGVKQQTYGNQDYEHQPSRQHDDPRYVQDTTHVEMSQLSPEPQPDISSNNDNNNPEVIDDAKMKKKGAVCCIIC
ncbi:hypothetical protein MVEG_10089 [Podila verticillata NRRL 6337]|nr:hypothetical protein MVEG_10089 [Podila verticillata NRRL 6337]